MLQSENWSYWERKEFKKDIDFIVIGAGIVGYSTALELRKLHPKSRIIILERGSLPNGASTKNAGFACFGSASEIFDDIQEFGEDIVWDTVKMRWKGLRALRDQIGDEKLDFQVNGSWDLFTEAETSTFDKILPLLSHFNEKLEEITGEKDVYSIDDTISKRCGFENIVSSFKNRLEGQIDTGSMNTQFHKIAVLKDIQVLFGCEVTSIEAKGKSATLLTTFGSFNAKNVAVCTNGFANGLLTEDVTPARAQVLVTKPISGLTLKGTFHYQKGYYYFRNIDNRVLFGGGRNLDIEGETTTDMVNTEKILDSLKEILASTILPNTEYEIDHSWAGIMGVGSTKKPIVKKISASVYCGVRLGGMGIAIGSLVGQNLARLITKEQNI